MDINDNADIADNISIAITAAAKAAAKAAASFAPPRARDAAYRAGINAANATFTLIEATLPVKSETKEPHT